MGVTIKYYNNKHKMADAAAPTAPAPVKKVAKAKKPAKPAAHPPFKAMILAAIPALKERGGSSRQAILKYIVANNKVDAAKAAGPLKLALRKALAAGTIGKVEKPKKAPKAKKPKAKKVVKKKAAKKPAAKKAKKPAKKAAKKPAAKKAAKKPAKKVAPKKKAAAKKPA